MIASSWVTSPPALSTSAMISRALRPCTMKDFVAAARRSGSPLVEARRSAATPAASVDVFINRCSPGDVAALHATSWRQHTWFLRDLDSVSADSGGEGREAANQV